MRLADFIRSEMDPIIESWEEYADSLFSANEMNQEQLRDHARQMLLAIAADLETQQSDAEQTAKSKGLKDPERNETSAKAHGVERHESGFSIMETVSEFRALRASVTRRWVEKFETTDAQRLHELIRFNEAIDQAVAESLNEYTEAKETHTRLFETLLLASPDPILALDTDGRVMYANKASADLFVAKTSKLHKKDIAELGFLASPDFQHKLTQVMNEQKICRGDFIHSMGSGQNRKFEYVLAPVIDESHDIQASICICRDMTEQALAHEEAWHNAHHDQLTGLPNRRLFMDRLAQQIKHAKRHDSSIAVFFMDLDGFKEINDSLGHEAGDEVLQHVAKRLAECVREEDTVARLGGDEFTITLADITEHDDLARVGRTIIDALAAPLHITRQPVTVSVSIGVSLFPQDASNINALLSAADKAMYKAKQSGTNQLCFGEPS